MQTHTLKLPDNWTKYLVNFPETGMGYQNVRIFLKGGKILKKHKVLNSSILILEQDENISSNDIERIEPDN